MQMRITDLARSVTETGDREVILAIRAYAKNEMAMSPPGYREGLRYITRNRFKMGLQELHCQFVEASPTKEPKAIWDIAPKMITGLMNIETEIYTVVSGIVQPVLALIQNTHFKP